MADLILPRPPATYNAVVEAQRNNALEQADLNNVKRWDAAASGSGGINLDGGAAGTNYGALPNIDGGVG